MDRDIRLVQGNTLTFKVIFSGMEDGAEVTNAYFTVKKKISDDSPIFQLTLGNGISQITDTTTYVVSASSALTSLLTPENYYYDCTFVINTTVTTLLKGILTVDPRITVVS